MKVAWGKHPKVSREFVLKAIEVAEYLGIDVSWLLSCIAFETGESFSPSQKNLAGSSGTGLIQFMKATAKNLGTSTLALSKMSAVEQLDYVKKYFEWKRGKLHNIEDVYMTILFPRAVGKPNSYVLFDKNDPKAPLNYLQNRGLDFNKDGLITKGEAASKVRAKLEKGMLPEFCLELDRS